MRSMLVRFFLGALLVLGLSLNVYGAPTYGGDITIVTANGPTVLGYYPEMGPTDVSAAFPGLESLMNMNEDRKLEPQLAESVSVDDQKLTVTFKLRKGVKFHDGSELTADVAKWMFDLLLEKKKIQYGDQIKKVSVEGKYKLVLYLNTYHNQMLFSYGWIPMLSKKSFDQHGKEWSRKHFVGTGPFKLVEWKRDSHMKWVKNENYWQKGKPYLDSITYRYIPDAVTASSLMLAKAADVWVGAAPKEQSELSNMGIVRQTSWPGMPTMIYLNTKNKKSPLADIRVRKALEYAINKPAIARAIGYGLIKPLYMIHPKGEWAFDPTYQPRTYNPEKARELLKEAGYGNGLKLDLLAFGGIGGGSTTGEAIKAFLGDVGIKVHLDMADPGRYFGSLFGMGWKDMVLSFSGLDQNSLASIHSWFGHNPKTNLASFERPAELVALSKKSITYMSEKDQIMISRKIARYIADEALMIPISFGPAAVMLQPYVHTNYMKTGLIRWEMEDMWMDKH